MLGIQRLLQPQLNTGQCPEDSHATPGSSLSNVETVNSGAPREIETNMQTVQQECDQTVESSPKNFHDNTPVQSYSASGLPDSFPDNFGIVLDQGIFGDNPAALSAKAKRSAPSTRPTTKEKLVLNKLLYCCIEFLRSGSHGKDQGWWKT